MTTKHTEIKLRKSILNYVGSTPIKSYTQCNIDDVENVMSAINMVASDELIKEIDVDMWLSIRKVICNMDNSGSEYNLTIAKVVSDIIEEDFRNMKDQKARYLIVKEEGVTCG